MGWDKQDLPAGYRKKLDANDKNLLHAETIEDLKRILEGDSIKAAIK